jgi:hypothetical protein
VHRDRKEPAILHSVEEGDIHVPHVIGEHVIEVADRLVQVNAEGEAKRRKRHLEI